MNCCSNDKEYPSDCELTAGLREMARKSGTKTRFETTVLARAEKIQLLLLDVDGVLTDGILLFSQDGQESKGFNTQDGFGIRLLQEAGLDIGVITARQSEAVTKRCQNLNMKYVYQGKNNKREAYNDILKKSGLKPYQICYMGDDWLDLVLLKRVGLSAAPANAVSEVKAVVHYICEKGGGQGAVREVCDLILMAKGVFQALLQNYMNK